MSRFDYFPLVLMNHSRTMNNRINALLHKRTLRLVWNNFSSSFSWRLKYWQKYFPRRKVIIVFEIEQCCRLEALKLLCMAQKIYPVWDKKYSNILPMGLKKNCVSYLIQNENSWMGTRELSMSFMYNVRT